MERLVSVEEQESRKSKLSKAFVLLYFVLVAILGLFYIVRSPGGNILRIIAYMNGIRDLPTEAFIYTSITEIIFEAFSFVGSCVAIVVLISTRWSKKWFSVVLHFLTVISFLIFRVALFQGAVHMSTKGTIKNTEFWDLKTILSQSIGSSDLQLKLLLLLLGIIIVPIVLKFGVDSKSSR